MNDTFITFIPFNEEHIRLMQRWLSSGEAKRWYGGNTPKTEAALRQKYLVDKPQGGTQCFIIQYEGKPIGYIQYYRVMDYPVWCGLVSGQSHDYGLDLFIGEDALIGRGIGTRIVKAALKDLIFANGEACRCILGPSPENLRAIRCYEKCGFQHIRTVTTEHGEREYVMMTSRSDHTQSCIPTRDDDNVIQVVELKADLVDKCQIEFAQMGWPKSEGYFAACLAQQEQQSLICYVALQQGHYVGHVKLVWETDYQPLKQAGIPEIQDLNVLPAYRRRGIATRLIQHCEATAATRSDRIGIGVGLHPGYNAAQRLYSKLGYHLDGHGVDYDGVPVKMGQAYPFDDSLLIHLYKELTPDTIEVIFAGVKFV